MAWITLVAGTTITASWANANVRDQVVTPFATAAARDSAITSPVNGMVSNITDDDMLVTYNGAAWVIAADYGAWSTYTPTLTQSGPVTKTDTRANYCQEGKTVQVQVYLTVTGTGTASNAITVSLPVSANGAGNIPCGTGLVFDTSAGLYYTGIALLPSSTTASIVLGSGGVNGPLGGAGMTAALAAGDVVALDLIYEAG